MERWHDPTGVVLLLGCFMGLWIFSRILKPRQPQPQPTGPTPLPTLGQLVSPVPRWAGPTLLGLLIGSEVLTEVWYRFHERGAREAPTWTIRWPPPGDRWREVPIPPRATEMLRYQFGRSAGWSSLDGGQWQMFFFIWKGSGVEAQLGINHSPETCLPASGRTLERREGIRTFRAGDLDLPFERYVFRDNGRGMYAFHCRWEDVRVRGPKILENQIGRAHV